jgi:Glycosyltransferase family 87
MGSAELLPARVRFPNRPSYRTLWRWLFGITILAAAIVSVQRGVFAYAQDFAVYRTSFWDLVSGRDLYLLRPAQYKYSPTFALLFAPFALPPFVLGLFLWNALNAVALLHALRRLLPPRKALTAGALVFLSMLRNMQSAQSNALVAALIIFAFISFERGHLWRGAAAIGVGAAIKIFPLAGLSLAISRPRRRRAALVFACVGAMIIALPLIAVPSAALAMLYKSWHTLQIREAGDLGLSVMGLLHKFLGLDWPPWAVQIAGVCILLSILYLRRDQWNDPGFQRRFLAFLLVFCVLFNHKAERQSYVIGVTGMIIWYLSTPRTLWRTFLFSTAFVLNTLIGSEISPNLIRRALSPEMRNSIPMAAVWFAMLFDLVRLRMRRVVSETGDVADSANNMELETALPS